MNYRYFIKNKQYPCHVSYYISSTNQLAEQGNCCINPASDEFIL